MITCCLHHTPFIFFNHFLASQLLSNKSLLQHLYGQVTSKLHSIFPSFFWILVLKELNQFYHSLCVYIYNVFLSGIVGVRVSN